MLKTAALLIDEVDLRFASTNSVEGLPANWMLKVVAGGGAVACKINRCVSASCEDTAGAALSALLAASKASACPLDSKTRNRPSVSAPRTLYSQRVNIILKLNISGHNLL